jgi:hypothetical protein
MTNKFHDLTFEPNKKLGYYTVNGKIYFSKVQALIESTNTGDFPIWNFNNEAFGAVRWDQDPDTNLRELYRIRAQQLRDKYDYIRVEFSGGSDSSQAVYNFLLNGIHLDEIVFKYPTAGEKDVSADPFNTKPENTLSEWEFAAKPMLHWVKTNFPNVKITMHDYSTEMLENKHDETWVFRSKDYFQPGHCFKHNALSTKEQRIFADQGRNTCVLYGIDKPKLCIRDKKWYLYFMDVQANCAVTITEDYDNITSEYFFWTPDMPELIQKQASIIKNWFSLPQNKHLQYLVRWPNYSFAHRTAYEQMIKPLIYPDFDPATFQTSKPTNSFYNEMDHWFYMNFKGTETYRIWQAGLNLLTSTIDPKFFNNEIGKPVGFVGFLSPFYCLGEADYVDTGINNHFKF